MFSFVFKDMSWDEVYVIRGIYRDIRCNYVQTVKINFNCLCFLPHLHRDDPAQTEGTQTNFSHYAGRQPL